VSDALSGRPPDGATVPLSGLPGSPFGHPRAETVGIATNDGLRSAEPLPLGREVGARGATITA